MNCIVCQNPASSTCGACGVARYCTVEHQKLDWKVHKAKCASYKIVTDASTPTNGVARGVRIDERDGKRLLTQDTHMIATRDLKPGMLLWEEPAIFQGPLGVRVGWESSDLNSVTMCISCGADLEVVQQLKQSTSCSKCKWPACSTECAQDPVHSAECKFFAKAMSINPKIPPEMHEILFMFGLVHRGANLKRTNPNLFKELEELYAANDMRGTKCAVGSVGSLSELRLIIGNGEMEFEEHVFKMIHQLIQVYGYINYYKHWKDSPSVLEATKFRQQCNMAIFKKASYLTHSCVPNCTWTIGPPPSYAIRIISSVPIKKGEKLTASRIFYPGTHAQPTHVRQEYIMGRSISCVCKRCADPSELETFTSGIVCPICSKKKASNQSQKGKTVVNKNHYLLPRDPFDKLSNALWTCSNSKCSHKLPTQVIGKITCDARKEIITMQNQKSPGSRKGSWGDTVFHYKMDSNCNNGKNSLEKQKIMEDFFKQAEAFGSVQGKNLLHPNHWVLLEPIRKLIVGENINEMPFPGRVTWCDANIRRIEQCLEVESKICPGVSQPRAFIQAKLAGLMCFKLFNFSSSMNRNEIQETKERIQILCTEALKFFKYDFPYCGEKVNSLAQFLIDTLNDTCK